MFLSKIPLSTRLGSISHKVSLNFYFSYSPLSAAWLFGPSRVRRRWSGADVAAPGILTVLDEASRSVAEGTLFAKLAPPPPPPLPPSKKRLKQACVWSQLAPSADVRTRACDCARTPLLGGVLAG